MTQCRIPHPIAPKRNLFDKYPPTQRVGCRRHLPLVGNPARYSGTGFTKEKKAFHDALATNLTRSKKEIRSANREGDIPIKIGTIERLGILIITSAEFDQIWRAGEGTGF